MPELLFIVLKWYGCRKQLNYEKCNTYLILGAYGIFKGYIYIYIESPKYLWKPGQNEDSRTREKLNREGRLIAYKYNIIADNCE